MATTVERPDAARRAERAPEARPFKPRDLLDQVVIQGLAVAPDGSSSDYTWQIDGGGYRDEFTSAWVVDAAGGKPERITAATGEVSAARWSPDGKQIAFLADPRPEAALMEFASLWTVSASAAGAAEPAQ